MTDAIRAAILLLIVALSAPAAAVYIALKEKSKATGIHEQEMDVLIPWRQPASREPPSSTAWACRPSAAG